MVSARSDDWSKLTSDRSNKILNSRRVTQCWPVRDGTGPNWAHAEVVQKAMDFRALIGLWSIAVARRVLATSFMANFYC